MIQKAINKKYIFISLLVLGGLIFGNLTLAQICPRQTTVEGQNVTFVGELTDTGGETTSVWFEYGETIRYGQRTVERTLTREGVYCITVSGLNPCTTYHYRAVARNSAGISHGSNKTFSTSCSVVSVDLKANNSDRPITIPYNTAATLTWNSTNATSCTASRDWSGTKRTSGSESTGNLISSQTFTLSCTGPDGTSSDSVTVNVATPDSGILTVNKLVRNLSDGTGWLDSVSADPNEILSFSIRVVAGGQSVVRNIIVRDALPAQIIYQGNLRIDNVSSGGNIVTGLSIGDLSPGQSKTITFEAQVASEGQFSYGNTNLVNTATVHNPNPETTSADTARIIVNRRAVAGAVTEIKTGINENLLNYVLFPLFITFLIILVFKNYFVLLQNSLEKRKSEAIDFRAKRTLRKVIAKIRAKENLS